MGGYVLKMPRRKEVDQNIGSLESAVFFELRRRQFQSLEKRRLGLFHVTDFVGQCVRKMYYDKLEDDATYSMDTGKMSHFFGGEAVHQLLDSVTIDTDDGEAPLWYNFVDDKNIELFDIDGSIMQEYQTWTDKEWAKIIIGERDAVYKVMNVNGDPEDVLIDFKTWLSNGYKKTTPSPEHVTQLNIYRFLEKKMNNRDIRYGAIIYLDFADKMAKPSIFVVKLAEVSETHAMLLNKYYQVMNTMMTDDLPDRTLSWLCNGYCPHASRCVKENRLEPKQNKLRVIK